MPWREQSAGVCEELVRGNGKGEGGGGEKGGRPTLTAAPGSDGCPFPLGPSAHAAEILGCC